MKFRVCQPFFPLRSAETWTGVVTGNERLNEALPAYLASLGFAPETPVTLDAETRAAQEAQWAVFVEQGVALRDPAALRWYAHAEFRRALKEHGRWTNNAVNVTVQRTIKVAGGVLPPALATLEAELQVMAEPVEKARRERRQRAYTPASKAPLKLRFDEDFITTAKAAVNDVRFLHPKKPGSFLKCSLVRVLTTTLASAPSLKFDKERRGRSNHHFIVVALKRDWLRKVHKAGLTSILGPRSFTLDADVSADGTYLTVAVQGEKQRGVVKIESGWLSLDRNNNRVLKKDKPKGGQ